MRGPRKGVATRRFTNDELEFLRECVVGRDRYEAAALFNARFFPAVTPEQIMSFRKNRRIHSGIDGRFSGDIGVECDGGGKECWIECGECLKELPRCATEHRPRCNAGYERQAKAIYRKVVKPLEKREGEE